MRRFLKHTQQQLPAGAKRRSSGRRAFGWNSHVMGAIRAIDRVERLFRARNDNA